MRSYGKYELIYEEAAKAGDLFLKFDDDDPPDVSVVDQQISVKIRDRLTMGIELEIQPDLLVLVTGMVPSEGHEKIADRVGRGCAQSTLRECWCRRAAIVKQRHRRQRQ